MDNSATTLIDNAMQYAREAIHEAWPMAVEVAKPTASMYEFDAICIDDEACPIGSISIMHDPDAGTFALVEKPDRQPRRSKRSRRFPPSTSTAPSTGTSWLKTMSSHI